MVCFMVFRKAYESALGVSAVSWNSPKSSAAIDDEPPYLPLLAVGSFDCAVRLVDGLTATVLGELSYPTVIDTAAVVSHDLSCCFLLLIGDGLLDDVL
jgi:hypothetical protein